MPLSEEKLKELIKELATELYQLHGLVLLQVLDPELAAQIKGEG